MTLNELKLTRENTALRIALLEMQSRNNALIAEKLADAGRQLDAVIAKMEAEEKAKAEVPATPVE